MTEIGIKELGAKFFALLPDAQVEVMDFIDFMLTKNATKKPFGKTITIKKHPFRSVCGIYAGSGIHITEEDINELRGEMRSDFPREEPDQQ